MRSSSLDWMEGPESNDRNADTGARGADDFQAPAGREARTQCESEPEPCGTVRPRTQSLRPHRRSRLWLLPAATLLLLGASTAAQVRVSVAIAPPMLPVYEQPLCPGDGYLWTPGYWAWDGGDYYWVAGAWVMPPEVGYLWTPGYWGWGGNGYLFNAGYWGLSVGFYGGLDYGFGYFGRGYEGGHWSNGQFFYNSTLNRINAGSMRNVYDARVGDPGIRVGYNGGQGGITARPTPQDEAAAQGRHLPATAEQDRRSSEARNDPGERFADNHGTPPAARPDAVHARDLGPVVRPAAPNTGAPKLDQEYQKEQDAVVAQQTRERQTLQARQDADHQKLAAQNVPANDPRSRQLEQQHQQQTRQLQQRQSQQMQQMRQRQAPAAGRGRG